MKARDRYELACWGKNVSVGVSGVLYGKPLPAHWAELAVTCNMIRCLIESINKPMFVLLLSHSQCPIAPLNDISILTYLYL